MDQRTRMKAEVERWRQSGLSQRAFAQELGIKLATFSYWVSRTKEAQKKKGFIPLGPGQNFSASEMEITYPNGGCFPSCVNSVTLNYRHEYGNTRRF